MEIDLSTAEKALHSLESAYRARNLELAQACRNFEHEAELMLYHLEKKKPKSALPYPGNQTEIAGILKRKWQMAGPPDFDGVTSKVASIEQYAGKFHVVTEVRSYEGGATFSQRIFMSHHDGRWAVLYPASRHEESASRKPWWAFWRHPGQA